MLYISTFCLFFVALVCFLAIFNHNFDDTLTQRIGLSGVCLWAIVRMYAQNFNDFPINAFQFLLHVSLAITMITPSKKHFRDWYECLKVRATR